MRRYGIREAMARMACCAGGLLLDVTRDVTFGVLQ